MKAIEVSKFSGQLRLSSVDERKDLRGLTRKFHRHVRVTQKPKQIRFGHQLFSLCSKIWDRKEMLTCLPRRARTRHAGALRILLRVKGCSACRVKKRTSEPQRCLPPVHRNRTTVAIYNSERPGLYVPFGTDVPLVRPAMAERRQCGLDRVGRASRQGRAVRGEYPCYPAHVTLSPDT